MVKPVRCCRTERHNTEREGDGRKKGVVDVDDLRNRVMLEVGDGKCARVVSLYMRMTTSTNRLIQ